MTNSVVTSTELRTRLSARLSSLYASEVPLYGTLVAACEEINRDVLVRNAGDDRSVNVDRVTAERHGAVRVGSAEELGRLGRILGAAGMYPVGFYDLRDAEPTPIPVVSTAFRPVSGPELDVNPFRVFTSVLVTDDRRFFTEEQTRRLDRFIGERTLFAEELLDLADRAIAAGALSEPDAERYVDLATESLALSDEPVDQEWYRELSAVSSVAADIGGVASTHINHLTPRVLDIDALYRSMTDRGVSMIDTIQGPPQWGGPDVLLRQTSFRALAEARRFRTPEGDVVDGELQVRFGEVEARGAALTPAGRDVFDRAQREVDAEIARSGGDRATVARRVWAGAFPATVGQLFLDGLAYGTFEWTETAGEDVRRSVAREPSVESVRDAVVAGAVRVTPIVYEDFLPRSAAGIFASNLVSSGTSDHSANARHRDVRWIESALGRPVHDPYVLYAEQQNDSIARLAADADASHPGGTAS